jgi:hypothetical protein
MVFIRSDTPQGVREDGYIWWDREIDAAVGGWQVTHTIPIHLYTYIPIYLYTYIPIFINYYQITFYLYIHAVTYLYHFLRIYEYNPLLIYMHINPYLHTYIRI